MGEVISTSITVALAVVAAAWLAYWIRTTPPRRRTVGGVDGPEDQRPARPAQEPVP